MLNIVNFSRRYNPADPLGEEWWGLPLIFPIIVVILSHWNQYGTKFASQLPEWLEIACVDRILNCVDLPNLLLCQDITWPVDVLLRTTPTGARMVGYTPLALANRGAVASLGIPECDDQANGWQFIQAATGTFTFDRANSVLTGSREWELRQERIHGRGGRMEDYTELASLFIQDAVFYYAIITG